MTKIFLSTQDKRITGVCGGIAEAFGIDSTIIRILFTCLFFTPAPIVIFYILASLILDKE
jgi:phage shock protein C